MRDLVERTKKYGATERISAEVPPEVIPDRKKRLVMRVAGEVYAEGLHPGPITITEHRLVYDPTEWSGPMRDARPDEKADYVDLRAKCYALPIDPITEALDLLRDATCNSMDPADRFVWAERRELLLRALGKPQAGR